MWFHVVVVANDFGVFLQLPDAKISRERLPSIFALLDQQRNKPVAFFSRKHLTAAERVGLSFVKWCCRCLQARRP